MRLSIRSRRAYVTKRFANEAESFDFRSMIVRKNSITQKILCFFYKYFVFFTFEFYTQKIIYSGIALFSSGACCGIKLLLLLLLRATAFTSGANESTVD